MKINEFALNSLEVVDESKLDEILGANRNGVIYSISHECRMNTYQFMFTCC